MMKQQKKKTIDVKEQLLCSAWNSFKEGLTATSVREIVSLAGVSKPALYYHFKNRRRYISTDREILCKDRILLSMSQKNSLL